jgi:regulator of protease activity HflC (stomatin/prohibitin superfamily)
MYGIELQQLMYPLAALAIVLAGSVSVIKQGDVGVAVLFGKYRRVLRPGLNFRIPFIETIFKRISLQHRSAELEFQAITSDQANVDFKALLIYAVQNESEETIKRAAFKFVDERSFMQALIRSVEGSIRSYVATKKQSEILSLRKEIVHDVNSHIEIELNEWGFHLFNLQINDIGFDEAIVRSMAQVVATSNMLAAAKNEAEAQYISKTRIAKAKAESMLLVAEAEKDADELRGEGNALMRKHIASGIADAGKVMETAGMEHSTMLYTEWLDTMKHVASHSRGNILSFDGSMDGFEKTLRQMALIEKNNPLDGKSRSYQGATSKSL